jgi:GxxExxY protein
MTDRQDAKVAKVLPTEPNSRLDDFARRVIGAAIEVHRHLGPGFAELVYEEALAVEFQLREIPFERQPPLRVTYRGTVLAMDDPTSLSVVR